MNKIILSTAARNDLKEIQQYITDELDNPNAAKNTLQKITKAIRSLDEFAVEVLLFQR